MNCKATQNPTNPKEHREIASILLREAYGHILKASEDRTCDGYPDYEKQRLLSISINVLKILKDL